MEDKDRAEWDRLHSLMMDGYREQLDDLGQFDVLHAYADIIEPSYRRTIDGEEWFSSLLAPEDAREELEGHRDEQLSDLTLAELRRLATDAGLIEEAA